MCNIYSLNSFSCLTYVGIFNYLYFTCTCFLFPWAFPGRSRFRPEKVDGIMKSKYLEINYGLTGKKLPIGLSFGATPTVEEVIVGRPLSA